MGNCSTSDKSEECKTKSTATPLPTEREEEQLHPRIVRTLGGAAGLLEMGFEYRFLPCKEHVENPGDKCAVASTCFDCSTRLFHVESGTMITAENRKECIPDGPLFDEVSCVSQEMVQERIQREYSMKFITICSDETLGEPIRALISAEYDEEEHSKQLATLLIITGKGKSRAGILSVKQILISGIEKGSAMFHLMEARKRGLAAVLLDPNARGEQHGMETVERSMTRLTQLCGNAPLYVLAHSAAGGYLVRYLVLGQARHALLRNIRAIAFTDSTHRIQWCREDPKLFQFLQSSKCLYIRNNSIKGVNTFSDYTNKKPGEEVAVDVFWCQRFGELRTVWAGTAEHSAMCWVARKIIWSLFDDRKANNL